MSLTATYMTDRGRVHLDATALGASATYAVYDRTLDGITYTTVRGGLEAAVTSQLSNLDDHEFPAEVLVTYRVRSYNASDVLQQTFTGTVTVNLTDVWIKVVARPYLNRAVTVTEVGEITRPARLGTFDVKGRSFPVSVSDLRGSRRFSLQVMTTTAVQSRDFDLLLASGEPIFLQVPPGFPAPSCYASVGDTTETEPARGNLTKFFALPLTEIAAPGPDVVGALGTWQTVLSGYATWTDLIAAKATWADVLELVGDPSEVIVS